MRRNLLRGLACLVMVSAGCGSAMPGENPPPSALAGAPAGLASVEARPEEAAQASSYGLQRIVFLGDSLTAGAGLDRDQAIPALIRARIEEGGYPYAVVDEGVSGDTSAAGLSRVDRALRGDVAILVLELGGNDGLRGLPPEQMRNNLAAIIERAQAQGVEVLLTGMEAPTNLGASYTAEFRSVFQELAREYDTPFLPFFLEGVAAVPALNQSDRIHPTAEGARIVANLVWEALAPLLNATHP